MAADSPLRSGRRRTSTVAGAPLRRVPKTLDEPPTVFDATGRGSGIVLRATRGGPRAGTPARDSTAPGQTDEEAEVLAVEGQISAIDPAVRTTARQIAAQLSLRRARQEPTRRRGIGNLASMPYRGGSDEIDLDHTIEVLAERPLPDDEDIVVRERMRSTRSVVLLVDISGSMRGERVKTAAATVGAVSAELRSDALGVIAFWSDAAILLRPGESVKPMDLLDGILRLPAQGLTNVAFPLELALQQLARVPARDARVLLLSDCVHNAGPDPRPLAGRLSRLDVLLDASGEKDTELGRELAAKGRGLCRVIHSYRDVAPAVSDIFTAR